ncbi:flagellar basal body rod protein FlgB [Paenibacillus gorillae]|uniref:flagellar basal body rod protein FlgB n=1 Tax=Paenibacillus gorillae TaxID=1243662 RepID=UPI0004B70012|nr:flagellar basal body rod protein FlgB [Paenibacillus gorillae]
MNLLNGASFQRLEGAVNAAEMRQTVLANNIANAETPGYKRSEVMFEQLLKDQMGQQSPGKLAGKRTNARHIPIGVGTSMPTAQLSTDQLTKMNNNENNVDIDREMSLLAKNQLSYNFYIQQISHDAKMMRIGIEGRI